MNALNTPVEIGLISVGAGGLPLNVSHRHFSLGRATSERLLSFAYSAADLFVIPTRQDNSPNTVYEAMACGTPVVGFDVGGIPDLVRSGATGLIVEPEDTRGLREAIETLLTDDDLRSRMGHESRKIIIEEYRLEAQAKKYQRVYEKLLSQSERADRPKSPIDEVRADALP
jgi:glycosyltransferase involved in cell wall biosynthesis